MACAASMQNELASLMFEEPPAMNCRVDEPPNSGCHGSEMIIDEHYPGLAS